MREFGDDIVLCVNNLSRFPQPVELDLRQWEGVQPVELLGGAQFPRIGELPYLLTVAGHGFYWLRIPRLPRPSAEPAASHREEPSSDSGEPLSASMSTAPQPEQPVDLLVAEDDE